MLIAFLSVSALGIAGTNAPPPAPKGYGDWADQYRQQAYDQVHPGEVEAAKSTAQGIFVLGGGCCFGSFWFLGMLARISHHSADFLWCRGVAPRPFCW